MRGQNTIVINGKVYDALTGLPAGAPDPVSPAKAAPAVKPTAPAVTKPQTGTIMSDVARKTSTPIVHRRVQRSTTLRRDALKKPHAHQTPIHQARPTRQPGAVERSPHISKFAVHPQPLRHDAPAAKPKTVASAVAVAPSAVVKAAHHKAAPKKPVRQSLSSKELKEKMIAQRLAEVKEVKGDAQHKAPRRSLFGRQPRVASILTACFALVILGGYLTYLNMPGLSVRVAATQAGVNASFPEYRPAGYSLDGPIAFSPGEVAIRFKANGGNQGFTLNQQKSTWDSQAVLDNYVMKHSESYVASSEQGLTIYTFGPNAAWVNGGILYTIEGDAPLSNDQILSMAASL